MEDRTESLFYSGVGPMSAILLGVALMPLRGLTPASNFTFVFLVLTIAAGELGGRWAAVATALTSALSLDFFLTRPYMKLSIEGKDDIIAFAGLAIGGLVAATFAAERGEGRVARRHLALLRSLLGRLERAGPLESRVAAALDACHAALPVAGLRVRDMNDCVVSRVGRISDARAREALGKEGVHEQKALPLEGALIALVVAGRQLGWLEVWGAGNRADLDTRRTLSAVAGAISALMAA
jgi:hypothetical protein